MEKEKCTESVRERCNTIPGGRYDLWSTQQHIWLKSSNHLETEIYDEAAHIFQYHIKAALPSSVFSLACPSSSCPFSSLWKTMHTIDNQYTQKVKDWHPCKIAKMNWSYQFQRFIHMIRTQFKKDWKMWRTSLPLTLKRHSLCLQILKTINFEDRTLNAHSENGIMRTIKYN